MIAISPPNIQENLPWRKLMVGSIIVSIYVSGILATLFPERCSRVFDPSREEGRAYPISSEYDESGRTAPVVRGHHPSCENFSAHVFQIGDKTFCAGCAGLFLGGLTALIGIALYFFGDLHIGRFSLQLVFGGVFGVICGLIQFPLFNVQKSLPRLFLNAFFAFGVFLLLIGIDEIAHSLIADLFLVALSVFWLFTRISLSRWDHIRICNTCSMATSCRVRHS
jgi:hypothetical protein